jgi:hypothetical protein
VEHPLLGKPKNQNRPGCLFLAKRMAERFLFMKRWGKKIIPKPKTPDILINFLRLIIAE